MAVHPHFEATFARLLRVDRDRGEACERLLQGRGARLERTFAEESHARLGVWYFAGPAL